MRPRKKAKTKRAKKCAGDRLSSLPDSILHHILSLQEDTKFAVRTCILSKRWKDLWKSLPIFRFDNLYFSRMVSFKKFVNTVLSRRDPSISIDKFALTRRGKMDKVFLNKVINHLANHEVKELTLQVDWGDFELPEKLLACRSITALEMQGFHPEILPGKWFGFDGLTVLHLNKCSFNLRVNVFDPFSSCPNLRSLSLAECCLGAVKTFKVSGPRLVEFSLSQILLKSTVSCEIEVLAPGLKSFSFTDSLPLRFATVDLPSLGDVHLQVYLPHEFFRFREIKEKAAEQLTNLFQVLHHAPSFTLAYSTIEILIKDPKKLENQDSPLRELKKLKLNLQPSRSSSMIPSHVTKYLLSASLYAASVEIEHYRMFRFKKFVTSVLSRHDPSITLDNFTLTRRGGNDKIFLTKVINYLVKHDVKELNLQVEWGDFVLPEKLLACRSVTALRMEGFRPENLPGKWFGFEGLNVLQLNKCSFNHQVKVFDPFSSCPNLRSLSLTECYFGEVKVFKISGPRLVELCLSAIVLISAVNCEFQLLAPGLKSFTLTDSLPMCFTMVELPSLRDVNLHVYLPYQFFRFREVRGYAARELTNLFKVFRHAQSFSLSYSTIEILIEDPNKLEHQVSPLRELKKLRLNMRHGESSLMIPGCVTKYLLSACLYTASVEIENQSDELEPWRVFHPSSLRRMRF